MASGKLPQAVMDCANAAMSAADRSRFTLAANRPEADEQWESTESEWLGKASMSAHHRFVLLNDLRWTNFNVLTLGIGCGNALSPSKAADLLEEMRRVACDMASAEGWECSRTGGAPALFFHCWPANSVPSLHLHVIDQQRVGPTYHKLRHRSLMLDTMLRVLREEADGIHGGHTECTLGAGSGEAAARNGAAVMPASPLPPDHPVKAPDSRAPKHWQPSCIWWRCRALRWCCGVGCCHSSEASSNPNVAKVYVAARADQQAAVVG